MHVHTMFAPQHSLLNIIYIFLYKFVQMNSYRILAFVDFKSAQDLSRCSRSNFCTSNLWPTPGYFYSQRAYLSCQSASRSVASFTLSTCVIVLVISISGGG